MATHTKDIPLEMPPCAYIRLLTYPPSRDEHGLFFGLFQVPAHVAYKTWFPIHVSLAWNKLKQFYERVEKMILNQIGALIPHPPLRIYNKDNSHLEFCTI